MENSTALLDTEIELTLIRKILIYKHLVKGSR